MVDRFLYAIAPVMQVRATLWIIAMVVVMFWGCL